MGVQIMSSNIKIKQDLVNIFKDLERHHQHYQYQYGVRKPTHKFNKKEETNEI